MPGQFQTRYYTVRSFADGELTLDVVVHDHGLVTEWAAGDCVGDTVTVSEPKASFAMPPDAQLAAAGRRPDRAARDGADHRVHPGIPVRAWAEVPDGALPGYVAGDADVTWLAPPEGVESATADIVRGIEWPEGEGYFWMAGESAQMRAIRKHLMRELKLPNTAYDVMGYWRGGGQQRQPRAVDPGPIWQRGKAQGKSDDEIWADYDAAREAGDGTADR